MKGPRCRDPAFAQRAKAELKNSTAMNENSGVWKNNCDRIYWYEWCYSVKPTDTRVGEWYLAEIPLLDPKFSLSIIKNNIKINRLSSKPLTCYECNPDPTRIPDPLPTVPDPIRPVPDPIRPVPNQAKFDWHFMRELILSFSSTWRLLWLHTFLQ